MREDYVDAVLEIVARIPTGKVLAYGDVAEMLGTGGPRQVGFVMSRYGSSVPWWRVIRASGEPPSCHGGEADRYYRREQTPLRTGWPQAVRIDILTARWHPTTPDWRRIEVLAAKLSEPHDEVEI